LGGKNHEEKVRTPGLGFFWGGVGGGLNSQTSKGGVEGLPGNGMGTKKKKKKKPTFFFVWGN